MSWFLVLFLSKIILLLGCRRTQYFLLESVSVGAQICCSNKYPPHQKKKTQHLETTKVFFCCCFDLFFVLVSPSNCTRTECPGWLPSTQLNISHLCQDGLPTMLRWKKENGWISQVLLDLPKSDFHHLRPAKIHGSTHTCLPSLISRSPLHADSF